MGFLKLDKNSIYKILVCKLTRVWKFLCDHVERKEMCVRVFKHSMYKPCCTCIFLSKPTFINVNNVQVGATKNTAD